MYQSGQGVPQDYGKAMEFFAKAADQGVKRAQTDIGTAFHITHRLTVDYIFR